MIVPRKKKDEKEEKTTKYKTKMSSNTKNVLVL